MISVLFDLKEMRFVCCKERKKESKCDRSKRLEKKTNTNTPESTKRIHIDINEWHLLIKCGGMIIM